MSERKLSVTITGPEGMLGGMATLLRDEGYIVEHTASEALDRVLAQYLLAHPKAMPSKTSVIDILEWLKARGEQLPEQRGRVEVLEGLMRETIQLWHEWSTTDITDDHDRWVSFTDRAHAWLARARVAVPDRTPKEAPTRSSRHPSPLWPLPDAPAPKSPLVTRRARAEAPPPRKKRPVR